MTNYLGNFATGATVRVWWETNAIAGESITRATNGTVSVYKNDSATQSTAGVVDNEDVDSLTGIHRVDIDLSADGTFYAAGSEFAVVLSAATIDGKVKNSVLAQFSIQNRVTDANVTKWNGTAVAVPATAGVPSVDAIAVSGDTTAADRLESQFDGTGLTGATYPARQDALALTDGYAQTASSQSTAANAKFGAITTSAGNQLDDWLIALAAAGATAPSGLSSAGFVPSTDSLEAQANAPATFDVADIFEADPADYDADADSFAARFLGVVTQTDLIGSAEIEVVAPVAATGRVTVYQGKDYAITDGTHLSWTSTSQLVLTGGTVTLDVNGEQFPATFTGSAGAWTIKVELTAAETAALPVGVYPYELVAELLSGRTPPPLTTGLLAVVANR